MIQSRNKGFRFSSLWVEEGGIGLVLLLMVVFFSLAASQFFSLNNLRNIFTQITINTIIATGMTFVIITGGIDLSVGSVMALAAVVLGKIITREGGTVPVNLLLGILAGMAVGTLFGILNGAIAEKWKLPAFIVTMGTMNIARGAAMIVTDARTIFSFPSGFVKFGSATILGKSVPVIFLVALVLIFLGQFLLTRTVFGRKIIAIGTNEQSVRISGHNVVIPKLIVFGLSGMTAGIAGIVYAARLTVANPILGVGYELNAIAATIIGGTSLNGGKGSLLGTFFGACIMGVLTNGLILLGVSDFLRQMITGFVIILAVIFDSYRRSFSARQLLRAERAG